jgi:lipoate-protein ligase A
MLDHSYASAFQNLAFEETLAHSTLSDGFRPTVRFWVDPPAAVVGRFQNVEAEVDAAICEQNNVQIVRRFTGGGAVFHDEGNLNFTVVTKRTEEIPLTKLHERYSSIIIDAMSEFDVRTSFSPPNSILASGRKLSGGAAALGKHFAFWHSSILVSTDTGLLERVLSPSRNIISTSFVRSRWQQVTTLQAALRKPVHIEEVKNQLVRSVEKALGINFEMDHVTNAEDERSASLCAQKYRSPRWNLQGQSLENRRKG